MIHYIFLSIYTIIILFLVYLIWKKTRNIGFVLGFGFLYYWSLLGSWFIVFDELTNQKGKEFGLAYYHYLEILFPVHADNTYLSAIHLYAIFIITIEVTVLFFIRKNEQFKGFNSRNPVVINHYWIITICISSSILAFAIVFEEILIAAKFEESIYYVTRMHHGKYYTIHQLLNQLSISTLYIGFITYLSKDNATFLTGSTKPKLFYYYFFVVLFVEGYLLLLGNKREIFFGGMLGIIFYLQNVNFKIRFKSLILFIVVMMTPLFFNDGLRSYSPKFLTEYFDVSKLEFHPEEKIIYTKFSAKNTAFRFLFSNEMFVPHFSMYGVLSHDVPPTYGSSFSSLGASIVPRFLWPDRPPGIYEYYIANVNAKPGRGYTIHHATAWYLNFGIPGILLASLLIGWIWSFFYNKLFNINKTKNKFLQILFIIGFAAFCAQIPTMIRNGPEGYKALIFESLLLPTLVLYLTSIITKPLNYYK